MSDKDLAKLLLLQEAATFYSSKDELDEYEAGQGRTMVESASHMKSLIYSSMKKVRKQKLSDLREKVDENNARVNDTSLITSLKEKGKELLERILNEFPDLGSAITLQNRDLDELTEEDIDIALKQLEEEDGCD